MRIQAVQNQNTIHFNSTLKVHNDMVLIDGVIPSAKESIKTVLEDLPKLFGHDGRNDHFSHSINIEYGDFAIHSGANIELMPKSFMSIGGVTTYISFKDLAETPEKLIQIVKDARIKLFKKLKESLLNSMDYEDDDLIDNIKSSQYERAERNRERLKNLKEKYFAIPEEINTQIEELKKAEEIEKNERYLKERNEKNKNKYPQSFHSNDLHWVG